MRSPRTSITCMMYGCAPFGPIANYFDDICELIFLAAHIIQTYMYHLFVARSKQTIEMNHFDRMKIVHSDESMEIQ